MSEPITLTFRYTCLNCDAGLSFVKETYQQHKVNRFWEEAAVGRS
jgi:hypothetical protein